MTDEEAVLEEPMWTLGEASGRVRAPRRLLLEHVMMDEARYLGPAARLSEALEATEAAPREARRLRSTVGDLEGGAPRMGARAALPVVAGWRRRPEETGHPELLPVAGTLSELGLSGGARDPAAVGVPLGTLRAQRGA